MWYIYTHIGNCFVVLEDPGIRIGIRITVPEASRLNAIPLGVRTSACECWEPPSVHHRVLGFFPALLCGILTCFCFTWSDRVTLLCPGPSQETVHLGTEVDVAVTNLQGVSEGWKWRSYNRCLSHVICVDSFPDRVGLSVTHRQLPRGTAGGSRTLCGLTHGV